MKRKLLSVFLSAFLCALLCISASAMTVIVEWPYGMTYAFNMEPGNTVADIKAEIELREGIYPDQQQLTLNGTLLEDEKTLSEYNIQEGCTLHFTVGGSLNKGTIKIFVNMPTGKTVSFEVKPTDLVEDLKAQIQAEKGIPTDRQILVFAGRQLEEGNTLQDYSIQKESVLQLQLVKAPGGATGYRLIHTYIEGQGTVDPSGTVMVRDGGDKTLTFTPAAGYEIADVVVNHKSVGAVSEYVLKGIDTDTSVEVTFVKTGSAVVGTTATANPSTGANV